MKKTNKKRLERKRRRIDRRKIEAAGKGAPSSLIMADCTVEIQAAEGDEDKQPTFSMVAYTGGAMRPRGFSTPVVIDLSGMKVEGKSRPIFMNHDSTKIVGHSTAIKTEGTNIVAEGVISGGGEAAQEVIASGKKGFPWQASVGASVDSMEEVEAGSEAKANGQTFKGPVLIARATTLGEISFVPIGADGATSATVAASADSQEEEIDMKFEQWVEAQGFVVAELSDSQKATLQAAYNHEDGGDSGNAIEAGDEIKAELADLRGEIKAEREALQAERDALAIDRVCAQFDSPKIEVDGEEKELAAHAKANKWSAERTELEALRASRSRHAAIHSRSHDTDCSLEAMQAAQLLRAGVALDSPIFASSEAIAMGIPKFLRRGINDDQRQRFMEAGHRYSDMSALDICAEAIRLDGGSVPHGRHQKIQAAFSGSALDSIFTQSVSASVLAGYVQSMDTTMGWTTSVDVPDFKSNQRERMDTMGGLSKLPRGQEADHASRSDVEETYKVKRYAKQFQIDEQDIIDDRLDVLSSTPGQFGAAAARLRPDLVYYILMANGALADGVALFHAASHGNLNTTSALAEATMKTAIARIEKQQDNGVNLNLMASHVIVPSDLKHTAANLIRSSTLVYGGDDETKVGSENTLASVESLSLVSDARLANGVTDPDSGTTASGSSSTWYMASAMAHTIEVGYLRGTGRAPQVRSQVLSNGKWGINWDVKMDIGAKALDYRGLVKSTG